MKKYLRNNMDTFSKVEWVKQLASEAIGVSDEVTLRRIIRRIYRKGSGSIRKYGVLQYSQQELVLDQLLKANEVSPRSAYRWFSLLKAPESVRQLGHEGKISQNEVERRSRGALLKLDPIHEKLGLEVLRDIRKLVGMM